MTTSISFKEEVVKYLADINFTELYQQIELDNQYNPAKLVNIIRYTLYFLELNRKLDPSILSCMNYFMDILEGRNEKKKSLQKIELLYLVQKLEEYNKECVETPSSRSNTNMMYM